MERYKVKALNRNLVDGSRTHHSRRRRGNESQIFRQTANQSETPHVVSYSILGLLNKGAVWVVAGVIVLVLGTAELRAQDLGGGQNADQSPPALSLTIRCPNTVIKAGDEIPIEFVISNRGTADYTYADRTYDRSGRMDEYKLAARNERGEAVPDPRSSNMIWFGGGLYNEALLKPGQSYTKVIPLNRWSLVKEPGKYTVTGTYAGGWKVAGEYRTTNIESKPIAVTVLPRTDQEMDAYLGDLTNQITAKLKALGTGPGFRTDANIQELVKKLMYTCSPKIVPMLFQTMYGTLTEPSSDGFWEREALLFYVPHTQEVRNEILEAMAHHNAANQDYLLVQYGFPKEEVKPLIEEMLAPGNSANWAAGAALASKYGDDDFTTRLIAITQAGNTNVRNAAIGALANNRTEEGLKTLKALANSADPTIWWPLAAAIQNADYRGMKPEGRPLQPGDFTTRELKPLIDRLMDDPQGDPVMGIALVEEFSDDDTFTARLIDIANHRGSKGWDNAVYGLALNRSDDGLKTLRELLNSSGPKTKQTVEDAIRYAYATRDHTRGRPLKPGDFDAKYQKPK